jgi:hypothetical protein
LKGWLKYNNVHTYGKILSIKLKDEEVFANTPNHC